MEQDTAVLPSESRVGPGVVNVDLHQRLAQVLTTHHVVDLDLQVKSRIWGKNKHGFKNKDGFQMAIVLLLEVNSTSYTLLRAVWTACKVIVTIGVPVILYSPFMQCNCML